MQSGLGLEGRGHLHADRIHGFYTKSKDVDKL